MTLNLCLQHLFRESQIGQTIHFGHPQNVLETVYTIYWIINALSSCLILFTWSKTNRICQVNHKLIEIILTVIVWCSNMTINSSPLYNRNSTQCTAPPIQFVAMPQCSSQRRVGKTGTSIHLKAAEVEHEQRLIPIINKIHSYNCISRFHTSEPNESYFPIGQDQTSPKYVANQ